MKVRSYNREKDEERIAGKIVKREDFPELYNLIGRIGGNNGY